MTVLAVTGAAGYIGGRVVADAAGRGLPVRAVVTRDAPWLAGEVRTVGSLEGDADDAVGGADAVVHLAGANEVRAAADPDGALASTVAAARAVAGACARNGVRRLVYLSTFHVYGTAVAPGAVIDEDTDPHPRTAYAAARLACEDTVRARGGPEVVVLRVTNAVGAPPDARVDRWSLLANDLCRQAVERGRLEVRSTGHQWRDFVALADVSRIVLAAAGTAVEPGTYNLGSGRPTTVAHLAALVADAAEGAGRPRPAVTFGAEGPTGPEEPFRLSVDRLRRAGLAAGTPLEDAVAETLAFCAATLGAATAATAPAGTDRGAPARTPDAGR